MARVIHELEDGGCVPNFSDISNNEEDKAVSQVSDPALVGAEVETFRGEFRPESIYNNASERDIFAGFFDEEVIDLKTVEETGTSTQDDR